MAYVKNVKGVLFIFIFYFRPFQINSTWWYLSQLPSRSLTKLVESGVICDNIPGLIGNQRQMCRTNSDIMHSVVKGTKMGVNECQNQFHDNRWNCSTSIKDQTVFGKILIKGSREVSFVHAITSAGVTYAITRACSKGDLFNCACDNSKRGIGNDVRGDFHWGGCSDNVHYGARFTRKFVDAKDLRGQDARAIMNLHNNRAGRRAVKKQMNLLCKCHGVSGACTIRTCWSAMQDFKHVGDQLKFRYGSSVQVQMSQGGKTLVPVQPEQKKPTRSDLIYLDNSPNYCHFDEDSGTLGTSHRECNISSLGPDGCDIICCGRGFNVHSEKRVRQCNCKFFWCCEVICKDCIDDVDVYTCKGNDDTLSPPEESTISNEVYDWINIEKNLEEINYKKLKNYPLLENSYDTSKKSNKIFAKVLPTVVESDEKNIIFEKSNQKSKTPFKSSSRKIKKLYFKNQRQPRFQRSKP